MNRRTTSLLIVGLVAIIILPCYSSTDTNDGFRASLYVRDPKYAAYAKIPLKNFDVQVDVIDFLAKVQITQVYKNEEEHPLECIYKFPLDEKSAITEFKAEIDGNVVVALSKPKQQALQEYNEAVERGHTAYLMEEERADIFTVNVGNLPALKEAKITVTYLTELTLEGDDLRFTLPTTIAPRYVPAVDTMTNDHRSTDSVLNPPSQATVPYKFGLNVDLQMPSRIVKVSSPTHPVSVELNGLKGNVKLSGAKPMDSDFVLTLNLEAPHEPRAWIETAPGLTEKAVLVALYPDLEVKEETIGDDRVVVFIVDVSGSMDGEKMKNVKDALRVSLDDIKRRSDSAVKKFDRSNFFFNIISFSSSYKTLFDAPVLANQGNYDTAMKFVESLYANGGTELYEPLKYVLERSVNDKTKQNVIVITDGEISDTDRTIAMVGEEKHKRFNRVFAVGIGYGVSHLLVNGLARAGDGIAEFVIPGEEVIEKINRQMQRALGSNSQEIKSVEWTTSDEAKVQFQTPYSLPTLYEGSRLLAYAMITGPVPDKFVVKTAKGDIVLEKTAVRHIHGDTIHKLAARSRIRDLEESRSEIHLAHEAKIQEDQSQAGNFRHYGKPQLDEESASKVKNLIIDLAQRFNLMSRETSFIAVDTSQENDASMTQQVVVPIQTVREEASHHRAYAAGGFASAKMRRPAAPAFGAVHKMAESMAHDEHESILMLDVAPVSLLVADHAGNFIPIVARNTIVPTQKTKTIVLAKDNTQQLDVNLYFGESNNKAENFLIQTLTLTGLDGVKQGTNVAELTIEIDVNNVITATLQNLITGEIITARLHSVDSLIADVEDYVQRILNGASALQDVAVSATIEL